MAIASTDKLITLSNLGEFKTKYTDKYVGTLTKDDGTGTQVHATVKEYVDAQVAASEFDVTTLKNTDTAVANQFVTQVSETDGIVTVSRAALTAADIPDLTLAKITDAGTAAAKAVKTTAIAEADAEEATKDEDLVTAQQVAAFVKSEVADIAGALHFKGIKTATSEVTSPKSGDVVIVGTTEYIYDGSAWKELGDEGNYVPKARTVAGIDLVDDITVAELQTALSIEANVLEGVQVNGTDLTITDKKVNVTVTTGSANGNISVNGADVAVKGLDEMAYEKKATFVAQADITLADNTTDIDAMFA